MDAFEKERNLLWRAECIVRDTLANRSVRTEFSRFAKVAYDIYYFRFLRFFVVLVILGHCSMALFEFRPMNWKSEPNPSCDNNADMIKARKLTIRLEWIPMLVYWFDLGLKAAAKGYRGFIRGNWNKLTLLFVTLISLDIIFVNINPSFPRYSQPLRPFLLMFHMHALRRHLGNLLKTLVNIRYLLFMVCLYLILFALVGTLFTRTICPSCDATRINTCISDPVLRETCKEMLEYWSSSTVAVLEMFVLLTTENYPDILYPFFKVDPGTVFFFLIFIIIGVFLLLSVLLAVIFDGFRTNKAEAVIKELDAADIAMADVFKLLVDSKSNRIPYVIYHRLMRKLFPTLSDAKLKLYFAFLDEDGSGDLDALEFLELPEIVRLEIVEQKKTPLQLKLATLGKIGNGLPQIKRLIDRQLFEFTTGCVLLLNVVSLITVTGIPDTNRSDCIESSMYYKDYKLYCSLSTGLTVTEYVFFAFYASELTMRLISGGLSGFIYNRWLWFDFSIVFIGSVDILVQIVSNDETVASTVQAIARIFRALRVIRLFSVMQAFKVLLDTFMQIIPNLASFVLLQFGVLYFYAILGVTLFQCKYVNADSDTVNFDTISGAMIILFQIVVSNNWNNIMHAAMDATSWSSAWYFVSFFVIIVMVFTNLLISQVIEFYDKNIQRMATLRLEKQEEAAWKRVAGDEEGVATYKMMVLHRRELALSLRYERKNDIDRTNKLTAYSGYDFRKLLEEKLKAAGPLGIGSTIMAARDQLLQRGSAVIKLDPTSLDTFHAAVEMAVQNQLAKLLEEEIESRNMEREEAEYQHEDERGAMQDGDNASVGSKDKRRSFRHAIPPKDRATNKLSLLLMTGRDRHGNGEGSEEFLEALRRCIQRCYVVGIDVNAPIMLLAKTHFRELAHRIMGTTSNSKLDYDRHLPLYPDDHVHNLNLSTRKPLPPPPSGSPPPLPPPAHSSLPPLAYDTSHLPSPPPSPPPHHHAQPAFPVPSSGGGGFNRFRRSQLISGLSIAVPHRQQQEDDDDSVSEPSDYNITLANTPVYNGMVNDVAVC